MTKHVCGKPYERDQNHGGMKDGESFSLKSYAILRNFKVYIVFLFPKPYTFLSSLQRFLLLSLLFTQQHSPLIVREMLLVVQGHVSYSHSLL